MEQLESLAMGSSLSWWMGRAYFFGVCLAPLVVLFFGATIPGGRTLLVNTKREIKKNEKLNNFILSGYPANEATTHFHRLQVVPTVVGCDALQAGRNW